MIIFLLYTFFELSKSLNFFCNRDLGIDNNSYNAIKSNRSKKKWIKSSNKLAAQKEQESIHFFISDTWIVNQLKRRYRPNILRAQSSA